MTPGRADEADEIAGDGHDDAATSKSPGRIEDASRPGAWILRENRRSVAAMATASITGIAATGIVRAVSNTTLLTVVITALLSGWAAFSLTHWWLCRAAYQDASGAVLRDRLLADPAHTPRTRWLARLLLGSTSSHSFAANAAGMALLGVIVLVLYPDLRRDASLLLLGVALVVTSWLDMAMAYAVQYARMDLTEGGLAWQGEREQRLSDYEYFASSVQSTLGTTDVALTTSTMRTAVRRHGLIAFTFNSVIVALLVSLVLTLG